jgi:hypothetical protein
MGRSRRRSRPSFRRDTLAVEGFMEEIPAVAVITFAVTAFMISAVSATGLYMNDVARSDALDRAKDICTAVASYGPLLVDGRPDHLSNDALGRAADGKLRVDLKNTGAMRVNVNERLSHSGNGTAVPSSWTFGNTDRTDMPVAAVTRPVLVGYEALNGMGERTTTFQFAVLVVWTW